jgi:hypothetical protein
LSRPTLIALVVAASTVLAAAGCGGGSHTTTTTTTANSSSSVAAMGPRPTVTKALIRQAWETFFDGSTSTAKRISLLQNGEQFSKEITAVDSSPLSKEAKAQVTSVRIDGPKTATVTFTVILGTTPVLAGVKGSAVLENGTWKVGKASFCQLAALESSAPKACLVTGK